MLSPTHKSNDSSPERPIHPKFRRQKNHESFSAATSIQAQKANSKEPYKGIEVLYVGIAIAPSNNDTYRAVLALHDGSYGIRCFSLDISADAETASNSSAGPRSKAAKLPHAQSSADILMATITSYLHRYRKQNTSKLMGAGITQRLATLCPQLPMELWSKLDIVPFTFELDTKSNRGQATMSVDEEAEFMVRKTVKQFTVTGDIRITFGHHHEVQVDSDGRAQFTNSESYQATVNTDTTWAATMKYANSLKRNNTKIAFFNSTPQGGGVALMRHALIRFLRLIGVDCTWYVPYGRPEVFRITKDNHNILQGVAVHGERLTENSIAELDKWALEEAARCRWLELGGPLSPRSKGGADIIIIDDPQMPSLVKLAKERDPLRPVVFRSHIQVCGDLANEAGTPTSEVWEWIWNHIKDCDVFVSHPVRAFVPKNVTSDKVGYLPATTDWKDGLNKHMSSWDNQYYMHEFKAQCFKAGMRQLAFPERQYIVQIARFDPAKGIPDVLESYAKFRKSYPDDTPVGSIPQLVIAGHGAVDDPDATRIFAETEDVLQVKYPEYRDDVIVMRLGPSDQMLNALMACAKIALQLSTREGFEVKVSEALHHGTPIIATRTGGIPLQVQHGKSGFLVASGDSGAVAQHLHDMFADEAMTNRMSRFAETHVSDEVGTVGNALSWLYLADSLANGETVLPGGKWINDMARTKAGLPYRENETRLPRDI